MGQSVGAKGITQATGGKVLTNQELKELAIKAIEKYKLKETIDIVSGAISKFFAANPDEVNKLNAFKGASTKKQFEVWDKEFGKTAITKNLAQPPRSVRAAAERSAAQSTTTTSPIAATDEVPFTPATIVSQVERPPKGQSGTIAALDQDDVWSGYRGDGELPEDRAVAFEGLGSAPDIINRTGSGEGARYPAPNPPPVSRVTEAPTPIPDRDLDVDYSGYVGEPLNLNDLPDEADLGGVVNRQDVVASGAGGFSDTVTKAATSNTPAPKPGPLRNRVAAGTAALGAAGAAGAALMDGESQTLSPSSFLPVVDSEGNLTMGPEEKKYYEKVGGWQAERKRQAEYNDVKDSIDDEIDGLYKSINRTPPAPGSPEYRAEAAKIIKARFQPTPAAPKPEDIPADELPGEGPSDQASSEEPGQAVSPALGSEGGAPAEATQPEAKALVQGGTEEKKSQANVNKSIQDIIDDRSKFRAAIGGRTSVDRTALLDAIKSLDTIEEELKKEQDPSKVPQLKDISAARRDALDAYKEKASMNEWLSIADRAIAAIAQFASGQAAMGTQYTGTYRPALTDYDAKTQQALREFQAEAGVLEKERAESEQQVSAYERGQEKLADRIRRQRESKVRLLEEDVRRQERDIDRAERATENMMNDWLQTQRLDAQEARAQVKETEAKAQTQQEKDKLTESLLQKRINNAQKILQAVNKFDPKKFDNSVAAIATSLGTDTDSLIQGIVSVDENVVPVREREKGFVSVLDEGDKDYVKNAIVPTLSKSVSGYLEDLKAQLNDVRGRIATPQGAPAPAPTAAPRQQPPATGTIKVRVGNQVGEIPANQLEAFKAKYPDSEVVK